jgi:alkylation response protein AidB-like acyl-CoA dehydrogenase
MDLSYGEEYERFRTEVRAFLEESWPPRGELAELPREEGARRFRDLATERGYLNRSIPRKYGGSEQEADAIEAQIIREEFARTHAPMEVRGIGTMMLVPTLLERGEEWQKEKFVPPTIRGEVLWCQGYSEPGSGSDLASLQTRAELVGDEWVINGQKIWTTTAQEADYMFCLCRTEPDAPKHAGISYLLIPMKQPGIEVSPLKRTTLKHERNSIGAAAQTGIMFDGLVSLAKTTQRNGRPAIEDPGIRQRLVAIEGYMRSHQYSGYYQFTKGAKGESPGIIQLMNKIVSTNIGCEVAKLALDVLEDDGMLDPIVGEQNAYAPAGSRGWINQYMYSLGIAVAGGTANIQRNVIAERGLGLPRDYYADRSSGK